MLTLLVGMWMCVCAYARCCNVSFVFLLFFFFSFCLKDTAFQKPFIYLFIYFFVVLAHALSESLMHVCVCVCAWLPKANNNKDPPKKKRNMAFFSASKC